jgi:hypothetical protein
MTKQQEYLTEMLQINIERMAYQGKLKPTKMNELLIQEYKAKAFKFLAELEETLKQ